jgi:hypothetical protein
MDINRRPRKNKRRLHGCWCSGTILIVHPAHGLVFAKLSAYGDYKKDGKDKVLQATEMLRTVVRHMATGRK